MTKSAMRLPLAAVIAGLIALPLGGGFAQEAADTHHPKDRAAVDAPAAPAEPAGPAATAAPMKDGSMGGMMGADHMANMMTMMQEMHAKMMAGGAAGMARQPKGDAGPSSLAYNGIVAKMHQDMAITYTGNADVDFVTGMIPHHQAAVDMAKTVLAFGKDRDVKEMAEDVVKAQEKEIAKLKEWLKKQGH